MPQLVLNGAVLELETVQKLVTVPVYAGTELLYHRVILEAQGACRGPASPPDNPKQEERE